MVHTTSLPIFSSSVIARRVKCDCSARSTRTFTMFSSWTAVVGLLPHSLSSNDSLPYLNRFHLVYIVVWGAASSPDACCIIEYVSTNDFWRRIQNFISLLSLHFTCYAQDRTNLLYATRCNSSLERQNAMKFCMHFHQTSTPSFHGCSLDGATCILTDI